MLDWQRLTGRRPLAWLRAVAGLLALLMLLTPRPAAAANVTLSLSASPGSVQAGNNVQVTVRLDLGSAQSLDAIGTVNYPADKLQFLSASGPGNDGPDKSVQTGAYRFDLISSGNPFTGSVTVVTLSFKAIVSSGSVNLSITDASVGDYDSPPPATHQVSTSGTAISFTAPPSQPPSAGTGGAAAAAVPESGQPSEEAVQTNAELDDNAPVPVTAYQDETAYPVEIKVQDAKGQPVAGTEVKLDDQTAETNDEGIASFTGVKSGTHTVSTNGQDMEITVTTGDPLLPQEFVLELGGGLPAWLRYGLIGLAGIALLAGLGLLAMKTLQARQVAGAVTTGTTAVVSQEDPQDQTEERLNHLPDPSIPKPDDVLAPTDPPKKPEDTSNTR